MARYQAIWLVTVLAASIVDVPSDAATRGYVVNPAGLLLTFDADTDIVVGLSEIPILPQAGVSRRKDRPHVDHTSPIQEATRTIEDDVAMTGRSLVTPQRDRLLVLDPLPYGLPLGFLIDEGPTGRIFVYDVATGVTLGHVAFFVRGGDRLAAVHPRGDKAYVASEGSRNDQMTITVISLITFTVVKELFVPKGDLLLSEAVR
jgi:DNA-binding beta-propeller fold protein YncE